MSWFWCQYPENSSAVPTEQQPRADSLDVIAVMEGPTNSRSLMCRVLLNATQELVHIQPAAGIEISHQQIPVQPDAGVAMVVLV